MPFLNGLGTVVYNGHVFNGSSRSKMACQVDKDRAGRTTVAVNYQLDIWEVILPNYADSTTNNAMNLIHQQLTATGQRLQFSSQGFGDFDINSPGGQVQDISYGPHPQVLEAVPLGGAGAWLIHWQCKTRIPRCTSAVYSGRPMESNYELEVKQDEHGFSTRTINGYYAIPANRVGRNISDTADAYWNTLYSAIPPIPGFRRSHSRKLSDDKRTMTYQIVDTELPPTGYQKGCTDWEGEQEIRATEGGVKGAQTISASYTLDPGRPKVEALGLFLDLVMSRVNAGAPFTRLGSLVPLQFVVRDQLHGQRVSFSLTYTLTAAAAVDILAAGGLFAPVPNKDWGQWSNSVAKTQSARGNANLVYDKASDVIIDLCSNVQERERDNSDQPMEVTLRGSIGFQATPPPPERSYLNYMVAVRYLGQANLDFYKPMQNVLSTGDYQQSTMTTQDLYQAPPDGARLQNNIGSPSDPPDIVMAQVTGDYYILLTGWALRAGYPVPMPRLLSVGTVPAYLVNIDFQDGTAMNAGIPIKFAQWSLLYRLPQVPLTLPTPFNPVLSTQ